MDYFIVPKAALVRQYQSNLSTFMLCSLHNLYELLARQDAWPLHCLTQQPNPTRHLFDDLILDRVM